MKNQLCDFGTAEDCPYVDEDGWCTHPKMPTGWCVYAIPTDEGDEYEAEDNTQTLFLKAHPMMKPEMKCEIRVQRCIFAMFHGRNIAVPHEVYLKNYLADADGNIYKIMPDFHETDAFPICTKCPISYQAIPTNPKTAGCCPFVPYSTFYEKKR